MLVSATAALGVGILLVVAHDLLRTTLAPASGAGPITGWLSRAVWTWRHVGNPAPSSWRLRILGPTILVGALATWLVLVGLGWWLVVMSPDAVVVASTGQTASPGERLYFVFTTLSTLGPGDVLPTELSLATMVPSIRIVMARRWRT